MKPQEELELLLQPDDKNWKCGDCRTLEKKACTKAKQARMDEKVYHKICGRKDVECDLCSEMKGTCEKTGAIKLAVQKACQAKDVSWRHDYCGYERHEGWKCACNSCQSCGDEEEEICTDYCYGPNPKGCTPDARG